MKIPVCLGVLALVSSLVHTKSDKCYGLALADGKGVGPYQAAVISALLENLPAGES